MARVLVIPDAHLKIDVIENGLELAKKKMANKIVLLGDYFDDWDSTLRDYEDMAVYLKQILKSNPNIIPLYGNHELSYCYPKKHKCSGFNPKALPIVQDCCKNNHRFLYAYAEDGILYSHAGVTQEYIDVFHIITRNRQRNGFRGNKIAEEIERNINGQRDVDVLGTVGPARGGHQIPGPLWADARELDYDAPLALSQVVGHTPVREILHVNSLWFTDVFSNGNECDQYLFVNEGTPHIISYNEEMNG